MGCAPSPPKSAPNRRTLALVAGLLFAGAILAGTITHERPRRWRDAPASGPDPAPPVASSSASLAVARRLVSAVGTGTQVDTELVARKLAVLSPSVLEAIRGLGIRVLACRDSVVDYKPELSGVAPRGWPAGWTWDAIPGVCWDRDVVVAVVGHSGSSPHVPRSGEGEASFDLVLHELGHSLDENASGKNVLSTLPEFVEARKADASALSAYESQPGAAGLEETWAETFARAFAHDSSLERDTPHLAALFSTYEQDFSQLAARRGPNSRGGALAPSRWWH